MNIPRDCFDVVAKNPCRGLSSLFPAFSHSLLVFHCSILIRVTGLASIAFFQRFYQHPALLSHRLTSLLFIIEIQGAQNQLLEKAHVKAHNIRVDCLVWQHIHNGWDHSRVSLEVAESVQVLWPAEAEYLEQL